MLTYNINCDKMIIPIRCMTCGKLVAHLWEEFNEQVNRGKNPRQSLDDLGFDRYCCRTLFLTQKDLIKDIMKFDI